MSSVMLPIPNSDLQLTLSDDRPTIVLIVFVVLVWPKLLAHVVQGPNDDVAHHQL